VLTVKTHVRLLGVILDKELTFGPHIRQVLVECNARFQQLLAVAGNDWGAAMVDRRSLYIAYIRSKILYCSPVFSPFISKARKQKLDVFERKCLRAITGFSRSTPIEDLYLEADLPPLAKRFKETAAIVEEKYRRFPAGDPHATLSTRHVAPRNHFASKLAQSWQNIADLVLRRAGVTPA
jgi:hypothetical protein